MWKGFAFFSLFFNLFPFSPFFHFFQNLRVGRCPLCLPLNSCECFRRTKISTYLRLYNDLIFLLYWYMYIASIDRNETKSQKKWKNFWNRVEKYEMLALIYTWGTALWTLYMEMYREFLKIWKSKLCNKNVGLVCYRNAGLINYKQNVKYRRCTRI